MLTHLSYLVVVRGTNKYTSLSKIWSEHLFSSMPLFMPKYWIGVVFDLVFVGERSLPMLGAKYFLLHISFPTYLGLRFCIVKWKRIPSIARQVVCLTNTQSLIGWQCCN